QLVTGDAARVHGVTEEISEILRYLAEIGLRPGVDIEVLEKAPLGGPLTVRVGERQHAISLELASMITVLPQRISGTPELAIV
ncbi:MAG: ferrous iron transport protein A, partial [Candidatus Eremiobacteraeota bacterium]|nr:ferrous iron transport protein A [Candidatus Eremiobacteraeota bacterium]